MKWLRDIWQDAVASKIIASLILSSISSTLPAGIAWLAVPASLTLSRGMLALLVGAAALISTVITVTFVNSRHQRAQRRSFPLDKLEQAVLCVLFDSKREPIDLQFVARRLGVSMSRIRSACQLLQRCGFLSVSGKRNNQLELLWAGHLYVVDHDLMRSLKETIRKVQRVNTDTQ